MLSAPHLNSIIVVDSVSGGVFKVLLDPFQIDGDPYL
jgi:hypothetical protein